MTTTLHWENRFNLGIPVLDEQHQALFGIYLELDEQQEKAAALDKKKIGTLLEKLEAYAQYHFTTEEELLRQASYVDYQKQCDGHGLFIKQINQFAHEVNYENPLILESLLNFIKKWLMSHILKEDRKYMECLLDFLNSK
jgi:hemerythrin-like metal-binding protein